MLDGPRLGPRRHFQHVIGHEIAASVGVGETALGFKAVLIPGLKGQQVVAEIKMDGNPFPLGPIQVGLDQKLIFDLFRRLRLAVGGHGVFPGFLVYYLDQES